MKLVFARLLAAALSAVLPDLAAAAAIDHAAWQTDYAALKHELELRYAHLAWLGSPDSGVDLKAIDQRALRRLAAAGSDEEARAAIVEFVGAMRDGHLVARATGNAPPVAPVAVPPLDLSQADAMTACAALGYAPVRSVTFSLPFESLPGMALDADGVSRAFRSGMLKTRDGTLLGLVRIARFRPQDASPALCTARWPRTQPLDPHALFDDVQKAWLQTLADEMRKLRAAGAQALVVDIGGNTGGNDSGDWSVRLLTDKPVRSAKLYMVAHDSAKAYFDEELDELAKLRPQAPGTRQAVDEAIAYFRQAKEALSRHRCNMQWVWSEQRRWDPAACANLTEAGYASGRSDYLPPDAFGDASVAAAIYWPAIADAMRGAWQGPAYIVTDGKTGSAAELFAALAQDTGLAKVIGTHTMGAGCGFMGPASAYAMPRAGLKVAIPNCVRLRADGTDEVAGIKVDIDIAPFDGESDRERAARAIHAIVRDLQHAGGR